MRHLSKALCVFAVLGTQPALADQDDDDQALTPITAQAPTFSVVGSLEGTYTNNAFFAPSNTVDDFYLDGEVILRLDGALGSDTFYRLYSRTSIDAFASEEDANNSFSLVGARLSRNVGEWTASLVYENRYTFDGILESHVFTAHDFKGVLTRDFDLGFVTLSPSALFTYRHADISDFNRYRMELWLGIEVPLTDRWSLVSEPFYEAFWFTDGFNSGRRDHIYSVSLGLSYDLSDNATLTTEVVYEGRSSNQDGRDYDVIEVGPRLDFAF